MTALGVCPNPLSKRRKKVLRLVEEIEMETGCFSGSELPWVKRIAALLSSFNYVSGAFVLAITILTVVHALGRYIFSMPIPGLVEMSSFMLVIIIFMAGAYTEALKEHTTIDVLVKKFPGKAQLVVNVFTHLLSIVITVFAFWQTIVHGLFIMKAGKVSTVLTIPHYPFLFVVALGWAILLLALVIHTIGLLREGIRGTGK
jgi:TRAP-type C4-dicarboxylate transport system permease small subunit